MIRYNSLSECSVFNRNNISRYSVSTMWASPSSPEGNQDGTRDCNQWNTFGNGCLGCRSQKINILHQSSSVSHPVGDCRIRMCNFQGIMFQPQVGHWPYIWMPNGRTGLYDRWMEILLCYHCTIWVGHVLQREMNQWVFRGQLEWLITFYAGDFNNLMVVQQHEFSGG